MNTQEIQPKEIGLQITPQSYGMNFTPRDVDTIQSLGEGTLLEPTELEEISQEDLNALLIAHKKFPQHFTTNSKKEDATPSTTSYTGNIGNTINPTKLPVKGRISQEYGVPVNYEKSGKHGGIDIAIPTGTPIPEVIGGTILESGKNGAWGNTVLVKGDDGITRRYSHLSVLNFAKGLKVKAGDIIGKSGSTGRSTGPHLDFREYK